MLRWGHDVIFLRVICISLIAIALIFILILTNVFVEVDSFFTSKTHNKENPERYRTFDNKGEDLYKVRKSNEKYTIFRSKRSSNTDLQDSFKLVDKKNFMYNTQVSSGNDKIISIQPNNFGTLMQFSQNKTDSEIEQMRGIVRLLETFYKVRPKRQVYYTDGTTDTNNNLNSTTREENKHIDIEIKTHFDSKITDSGRKQFITHLIEKIRRALRSDTEVISNQIEYSEPYFRTREQEPIVITKKITYVSRNIPQPDNDDIGIGKFNKKPKFKNVATAERGNKYIEDFQNSLEIRFQKPIADITENNNANSELYADYNSLSLPLSNMDGAGVSMDRDHYKDESGQKLYYNGLDDIIKVYHNTIM